MEIDDSSRSVAEEMEASSRVAGLLLEGITKIDQGSDPAGMDTGIPAGFFQHHPQIILVGQVTWVIAHPAQLHGLPLHRLPGHMPDFGKDQPGEGRAKEAEVVH